MKIVVTGAAGRLGRVVMQHLRQAGHVVTGIDRTPCPGGAPSVKVHNLLDAAGTHACFASEAADAVVHLANHSSSRFAAPGVVSCDNTRITPDTGWTP